MTNGEAKIRRTLQFKFTLTGASDQMIAMMKSTAPLYQMFGKARVRLLQNVDDPSRFIQEIDYETPERDGNESPEDRERSARAGLSAGLARACSRAAIEIDVYKEM